MASLVDHGVYYLTAIAYDTPSDAGAVWAQRARARLDAMLDQTGR